MDKLKAGRPSSEKKGLTIDDLRMDKKSVTIQMSKFLHVRLKKAAIDREKTMKDMIVELLEIEFGK